MSSSFWTLDGLQSAIPLLLCIVLQVDGFDNCPDLVFRASTTWGSSGVTDRDWALLGIANVGLSSCLGNI